MQLSNLKKTFKPYNMAMISVFIAIFSINIVSLISMAGKKEIAKELDGVGLNGMSVCAYNSYNENITDISLYEVLYNCDKIDLLTPVLYDGVKIQFSTGAELDSMCWGISPMAEDIVNLDRLHGRMLTQTDIETNAHVCLVDENVAIAAYGRSNIIGKTIYINLAGGIYPFEVVGVVNKTSSVLNSLSGEIIPNFIYIPYSSMSNLTFKNGIDQILINVSDSNVTEDVIAKYVSQQAGYNQKTNLKITNLSQQRDIINNIVNVAFFALFAVSCVAVIVCSISVATSVNTAVTSAKHDIGIKISLGAGTKDIMTEFLLYSVIACIIGIVAGTVCGFFVMMITNIILKTSYTYDYVLLISGISATILLAIIFSIYPSYQAANLLPVKALSRE